MIVYHLGGGFPIFLLQHKKKKLYLSSKNKKTYSFLKFNEIIWYVAQSSDLNRNMGESNFLFDFFCD